MAVMFAARGCRQLIVVDACRSGCDARRGVRGAGQPSLPSRPMRRSLNLTTSAGTTRSPPAAASSASDFRRMSRCLLIEARSLDFGIGLSTPVVRRGRRQGRRPHRSRSSRLPARTAQPHDAHAAHASPSSATGSRIWCAPRSRAAEDDSAAPAERAEMLMEIAMGLQQRPKTPEHLRAARRALRLALWRVCPSDERLLRARIIGAQGHRAAGDARSRHRFARSRARGLRGGAAGHRASSAARRSWPRPR